MEELKTSARELYKRPGDFRIINKIIKKLRDNMLEKKEPKLFAGELITYLLALDILRNETEDECVDKTKVINSNKALAKSLESLYKANNEIDWFKNINQFAKIYQEILKSKKTPKPTWIGDMLFYEPDGDLSVFSKSIEDKFTFFPDLDILLSNPVVAKDISKKYKEKIKNKLREKNLKLDKLGVVDKPNSLYGTLLIYSYLLSEMRVPGFIYRSTAIDKVTRLKGNKPIATDNVILVYDLINEGEGLIEPIDYLQENHRCYIPFVVAFMDFENKETKEVLREKGVEIETIYTKNYLENELREYKKQIEEIKPKLKPFLEDLKKALYD